MIENDFPKFRRKIARLMVKLSFKILIYLLFSAKSIEDMKKILKRFILTFDPWRSFEYPLSLFYLLKYLENLNNRKITIRILDMGSGDSQVFIIFLYNLQKLFKNIKIEIFCIDIDKKVINNLRHIIKELHLNNIYIFVADARKLPFKSEKFDVITCISTLEHIPGEGDLKAFQEISRVIKPNGMLVITIPFSILNYEITLNSEVGYFTRVYTQHRLNKLLQIMNNSPETRIAIIYFEMKLKFLKNLMKMKFTKIILYFINFILECFGIFLVDSVFKLADLGGVVIYGRGKDFS